MEKPPITLAIVGKNLSSCVAALHLVDHLGSNLSWFQTLKDPDSDSEDQLTILTPLQRNQIKISIENEVLTDNPKVFIGSHRHYPIEHAIQYLKKGSTDCPYLRREHPAVLAKTIASALWNDLNPTVIDSNGVPRPRWVSETPPTSKDWESGAFSILRREQLFKATEAKLREKKVRVDFEKKRVLGIDRSSFHDGIRLIFNAPFGSDQFQALLWTSVLYSVKDEGEKKRRTELNPAGQSIAFWKTYATDAPSNVVGFFPSLSVWIPDDESGRHFRNTGLLSSGAVRRVVCVPQLNGTHRLQIQSLHFYDNPRRYERPDEFLWQYCPNLKKEALRFTKSKAEENLVFRSPFSMHQRLANRFDFWMGGVDCGFSRVPKFQWGIDGRRIKRDNDHQPPELQL